MHKTIKSPRNGDDEYYPKQELAKVFAQRGYNADTAIKYSVVQLPHVNTKKKYLCEVSTPTGPFYSERETSVMASEFSAAFIAMRALARAQQFRRALFDESEVKNSMDEYTDDLVNAYANSGLVQRNKRAVICRKKRLSFGEMGIVEDNSSSDEEPRSHSMQTTSPRNRRLSPTSPRNRSMPPTSPRGQLLHQIDE